MPAGEDVGFDCAVASNSLAETDYLCPSVLLEVDEAEGTEDAFFVLQNRVIAELQHSDNPRAQDILEQCLQN